MTSKADSSLYEIATRRRRMASKVYLIVLTTLTILLAISCLGVGIFWGGISSELGGIPIWTYPILAYALFLILPVLFSLPVVLPWAYGWREPRRIVVFRRFNVKEHNAALRRLLPRYLSPLGHVFTLADKGIRIPLTVRIPLMLGQLSFVNFRPLKVDSTKRLGRLERLLERRWWLNVNWLVSYRKIFAVRASDDMWQSCIHVLLKNADLVIMDVSIPSEALVWEIAACLTHGLRERTTFFVEQDLEESSKTWIKEVSKQFPSVALIPIFTHKESRLKNPDSFTSHTNYVLTKPVCPGRSTAFSELALKFLAIVVMSVAITLVSFIVSAPYVFSTFTARYSPWRWPVVEAYLFGMDPDAALKRIQRDYYDWALPKFGEWARSPRLRLRSLDLMKKIGDVRVVRPLLEIADAGKEDTSKDAVDALRTVMARLGPPAVPEYVAALRSARQLEFDLDLYRIVRPTLLQIPVGNFIDMLNSPSSAARFTAGLRIAVAKDLRAVPSLFEMVNWKVRLPEEALLWHIFQREYPLSEEARNLLESLMYEGHGELDVRWLEPRLFHDDWTCNYSVLLALSRHEDQFLLTKLRSARPGEGRTFLRQLALLVDSNKEAIEILNAADQSWLRSNLTDEDDNVRLSAALAVAMRGDTSALSPTLELLRIKGVCGGWLSCHPYEDEGNQVLYYLAERVPHSGKLSVQLIGLNEIPISSLIMLVKVSSRSGDRPTTKALIEAYASHPDAATQVTEMELAIPNNLLEWVVARAQNEEGKSGSAALVSLAREIVKGQCASSVDVAADNDNLLESLRHCR